MTDVWVYILTDYAIFFQLYPHGMPVCIFMFFPFSLQAPAPQEGGAKAEVSSNISPPPFIIFALSGSEVSLFLFH